MTTGISTTIELNPELTNLACEMGLNILRSCENALKGAIRRLRGSNSNLDCVRNVEVEVQIPLGLPHNF